MSNIVDTITEKHFTNKAEYDEFIKMLDSKFDELSDNRFAVACMRHFDITSYTLTDSSFYAIVSVWDYESCNLSDVNSTQRAHHADPFGDFVEAYVFTTEKEAREKFLQLLGERISNSYGDE